MKLGVVVLLTQMVVAVDVNPVNVTREPEQSVYDISVVTKPTLICHSVHGAGVGVGSIVVVLEEASSFSIISLGKVFVYVLTSSGVFKS